MNVLKRKTIKRKSRFVIKAIAEELMISQEQVVATANLARDLGADELDMIAIVNKLEEKFSREVTAREVEELKTVQDVINLFSERTEPVTA